MSKLVEHIRLFFVGKGKTKPGAILFIVLGIATIIWPAITIEYAYFTHSSSFMGPYFLLCMLVLAIGGVYPFGVLHIAIWIWGSIAIALHQVRLYMAIVFFVLMVVSISWITVLWISDDLSPSIFKKGKK